MKNVKH